jgi:formylglycine-generating enzyme required for sulfatase activity
LPAGTAEGCREPLSYAEERLSAIGRDHLGIDDEDADLEQSAASDLEAPPAPSRDGAVGQALGRLLVTISYARSEYRRQAAEALDDGDGPERSVRPSSAQTTELTELHKRAGEIGDEVDRLNDQLGDPTHFKQSENVDQLARQGRDAGTHLDLARHALDKPAIRPGVVARLARILSKLPEAMERTGGAFRVGIDVAEPFFDQWLNQLPTDIFKLVVKHLRAFAGNLENAGRRLAEADHQVPDTWTPGTVFRDIDAPWCPEMVVIPAGTFMMGSPPGEPERDDSEGPQREVTFASPFALGRYPVTFDEFDHFCRETGREPPTDQKKWGRLRRPAVNVSVDDAEDYLVWLADATGRAYQLPSEAVWEYGCRAGTITPFWTGETISTDQANYDGNHIYGSGRKGSYRKQTTPVGHFPANPFGLYDMHGDVWEWCADPWHQDYHGASTDGSVWLEGGDTSTAVARGGSWNYVPRSCRSAFRNYWRRGYRGVNVGFRAARMLG